MLAAMLTLSCGGDGDSLWDANSAGMDGTGADSRGDDGADGNGTADDGAGTSTGEDGLDETADDEGGIKLDVMSADDGSVGGGCGCEHTYIWVANTEESTVSKINTKTLEEEGRYRTTPDGGGSPSRTSVNLVGDVAVANRTGGLVKSWADTDNCVDRNGDGTIQTSTGKGDVLPWAAEECRAWLTEFNTTNQRPVAWTGGVVLPDSCDASTAKVWTVTSATPGLPGLGGEGGVIAYLLDGETGDIEETVAIPDFNGASFGAYGGAVDNLGNLWFSALGVFGPAQIVRVDNDSLTYEIFMTPPEVTPYGITVDHKGRPWVASIIGSGAGRFDYDTQTWAHAPGFFGGSGITQGPEGDMMYVAAANGVQTVDVETMALGPVWSAPQGVKGVGFDVDGYLWAVAYYDDKMPAQASPAFKVDVDTMTAVGSYDGLDEPYTYSDMTGSALGNVTCPPAG